MLIKRKDNKSTPQDDNLYERIHLPLSRNDPELQTNPAYDGSELEVAMDTTNFAYESYY